MRSVALSCVFVLVALSLFGCADGRRAPAKDQTVQAARPAEKDAPVKPLAMPGRWHAVGRDQAGYQWEGYLVVDHATERYLMAGYFEWEVKVGGGRYHFEGTFAPEARRVHWIGYSVEHRVGTAAMATYQATLSADGKRFENGTWSGGNSIPGTWTAEYVGE